MAPTAIVKKTRKRLPQSKIEIIRAANLRELSRVVHGFSTRFGGFSEAYGGRQAVERNRRSFLSALNDGKRSLELITLRQIHSGLVHILKAKDRIPKHPLRGDGIISSHKDVLLGIQIADCVPVLVVDAKRGAIGAFHAGWRGAAGSDRAGRGWRRSLRS